MYHQFRRAHVRVGFGDRKLNALVLAYRTAEDASLLGIVRRLVYEPLGVADALRGDEDALGVHARKDVAETFAFLADQVPDRHLDVVKEHLGGGVVHHRADRADG